ncbi:MAG: hypothetical protein VXW49_08020, partial [Pseudomonadota bacterium]|nr:hypothetical protein [Pseudomonadota bacterium]
FADRPGIVFRHLWNAHFWIADLISLQPYSASAAVASDNLVAGSPSDDPVSIFFNRSSRIFGALSVSRLCMGSSTANIFPPLAMKTAERPHSFCSWWTTPMRSKPIIAGAESTSSWFS